MPRRLRGEETETVSPVAQALQELMTGWNTIFAAARKQFPAASEEELYQIAKRAMFHALRMEAA